MFEFVAAISDGAERRVIPRDEAQSPAPWRSQPCHAFAEPSGYRRTRKDMARSAAEYRRTLEEPLGYGGHDIRPVRIRSRARIRQEFEGLTVFGRARLISMAPTKGA